MNKANILKNIPAYYKNSSHLSKITEFIAKSSIRAGALVINEKEDNFLLLKEGNIYVDEDWQAYSLLRASSKLLICSGQSLRKESEVFKSRQSYGNKNIEELNQALLGKQKQKLFIFTRSLTLQNLKASINEQFYDIIQVPHVSSVYHTLDTFAKQPQNLPITFEAGVNLLTQYFEQVNKGKKNLVDTLLISKFSGQNISKYKGPKFSIPLEHYNLQWKSDTYSFKLSDGNQGKLTFECYLSKQK